MAGGAKIFIDAYAVLGVAAGADLPDIKRIYKKLAREFHPDVNPASGAEDRFKQISAAYDLIKDEERRAAYDKRRASVVKPAARPAARPPPPRARPPAPPPPPPPPRARPAPPPPPPPPPVAAPKPQTGDTFVKVELSYREAIEGGVKEVLYRRRQLCHACGGVPTPRKTCRVCWDAGWEDIPSTYSWTVPPGTITGALFVIRGLGDRMTEPPRNLCISVGLLKMHGVTREGLDFQVTARVPAHVLERGGSIIADGPAGPLTVQVPPGSKSGVVVRVAGAGLPKGSQRGSVFVTVRSQIR
jgi:curved DNA-binding protein